MVAGEGVRVRGGRCVPLQSASVRCHGKSWAGGGGNLSCINLWRGAQSSRTEKNESSPWAGTPLPLLLPPGEEEEEEQREEDDDAPLEGEVWDFFRFLLAGSAGGVGNEGGGTALGVVPDHS